MLFKKSYYNYITNNIILKKKKLFKIKTKNLFNSIQSVYYSDKHEKLSRKKLLSNFFNIFRKMENMSGNISFFKTIKIKVKLKKNKKKLRKKSFLVVVCNFFNNFDSFFNFFLINNYKLKFDDIKTLKHKYKNNQEFLKKNKMNSLILKNKQLFYHEEILLRNFTNKKIKKHAFKFKSKVKKIYFNSFTNFLPVNILFKSFFVSYIYKFFSILILQKSKLLVFLYKFYRNKVIKI